MVAYTAGPWSRIRQDRVILFLPLWSADCCLGPRHGGVILITHTRVRLLYTSYTFGLCVAPFSSPDAPLVTIIIPSFQRSRSSFSVQHASIFFSLARSLSPAHPLTQAISLAHARFERGTQTTHMRNNNNSNRGGDCHTHTQYLHFSF